MSEFFRQPPAPPAPPEPRMSVWAAAPDDERPLPPGGPVAFLCEWPAESIPLTRREIDAEEIPGAASRCEAPWPE